MNSKTVRQTRNRQHGKIFVACFINGGFVSEQEAHCGYDRVQIADIREAYQVMTPPFRCGSGHDHSRRSIDRFVDLGGMREHLRPYYSDTGRPPIDPELMIRMRIISYCMGVRSERRLCEEVHLNLAYRWFCRLGPEGTVPDHSTFSKNRHGRFRDSDLFAAAVRDDGFALMSIGSAPVPGEEVLLPEAAGRAVREYLDVLDDAAFGGAAPMERKTSSTSPLQPRTCVE